MLQFIHMMGYWVLRNSFSMAAELIDPIPQIDPYYNRIGQQVYCNGRLIYRIAQPVKHLVSRITVNKQYQLYILHQNGELQIRTPELESSIPNVSYLAGFHSRYVVYVTNEGAVYIDDILIRTEAQISVPIREIFLDHGQYLLLTRDNLLYHIQGGEMSQVCFEKITWFHQFAYELVYGTVDGKLMYGDSILQLDSPAIAMNWVLGEYYSILTEHRTLYSVGFSEGLIHIYNSEPYRKDFVLSDQSGECPTWEEIDD